MNKKLLFVPLAAGLAFLLYFVILPAFVGKLLLSPAVEAGNFVFRWYGLILALSVMVGYLIARAYSWRFGIAREEVDNFSFWLVIISVIGARIYFVLFAFEYFSNNPQEIYKIWNGGISIYGALISGLLFTFLWCYKKAYSFRSLLDLLALSLPLSQALGRFGNFVNQEAFGVPTNLPWKMYVAPENRPVIYADSVFFHPTFLYEALALVAAFFILRSLALKLKPGVLGFVYFGLYSLIRFFVEQLRTDSVWISGYRADQVVSLICVLVSGIVILIWQFGLGKKPAKTEVEKID